MGSSNCSAKKKASESTFFLKSLQIKSISRIQDSVKTSKFNSAIDLGGTKINLPAKSSSGYVDNDNGFKEIKLEPPPLIGTGRTLQEKKNIRENFDVHTFYLLINQIL